MFLKGLHARGSFLVQCSDPAQRSRRCRQRREKRNTVAHRSLAHDILVMARIFTDWRINHELHFAIFNVVNDTRTPFVVF